MKDKQSERDVRGVKIDRVGVKGLRYPIQVRDLAHKTQSTIATITMSVDLPHHFKGTHMSRFVEILNEHGRVIHVENIPDILCQMRERLDAEYAHLQIDFPYFIEKKAPVTKAPGMMDYKATFMANTENGGKPLRPAQDLSRLTSDLSAAPSAQGEAHSKDRAPLMVDFVLGVSVPVTTLCPCSKAISARGAHNQRGMVNLHVRSNVTIWIEELIELAEASASCELYSLLKREDEKYVTERAYDNPVFVEDLVRNVAVGLRQDRRVRWYRVEAENFESIHHHNAYAMVESQPENNLSSVIAIKKPQRKKK